MRPLRNIIIVICLSLLGLLDLKAQDVQLSQFHVADLLMNPALTGSKHRNRLMFHQRWQWPSLPGSYNTSLFSYDRFFYKYKVGLGANIMTDNQGDGIIRTTIINTQYSYETELTDKIGMRLGAQLGMFNKRLNDEDLIYSSQVTADGIDYGYLPEKLGKISYTQPDFAAGGILYTDKIWLSVSAYHLNKPKQDFLGNTSFYPVRTSFIAGYKFPLGQIKATRFTGHQKEFYIFPVIHYKTQGKSDQLEAGIDLINDQLRLGFWYRGIPIKRYDNTLSNHESFILLAGWRYGNFEFVYSYDIVISRLERARTGGAHELHVSFIWPREVKHGNFKKLPCPDFQKATKPVY